MPAKTSKSLFSQHYLTHRLSEHEEWHDSEIATAYQTAVSLYHAKQDILPQLNEAQTEQEFIQPMLEQVLGFESAYSVQTTVHAQNRVQRPDYALFPNIATKTEADRYLGDEPAFYSRAVAVADAKYWQRPLSQKRLKDARDSWRNTNPSFQIVNYLVATGVDWGVLTNGRLWRLYSRQVSSTATEFYEIDLIDIFNEPSEIKLDAFKRFWLFFRRSAFVPDGRGNSFLDRVRDGSASYARVVGDQLKTRVFNDIFSLLAGGLVADMAWRNDNPNTEESKRLIYESTLSLLYKLLFLLYGEARNLLPIDNAGYRRESITSMVQEVAELIDKGAALGTTSTRLHKRLLALFELIDRGDRGLGLPYYNGGLFHFDFREESDQQKHPANYLLTQYNINDARLAQAIDLLARIDGEMIDYGYIGVRHLGAIYEGLLEYKLVIDDATNGEVHLENDKGERKATGSYYTPDYIVKYIVSHTLGPILDERAARFATLMTNITAKAERLQSLNLSISNSKSSSAESRARNEQQLLQSELARLAQEARETLLDIKVCDPAMGSGHFLVEVVDFLTTRLITILTAHPDHNPVLDYLARIRQSILDNMTGQGIAVDPDRLDDTQLLQRVVMKRSIYGVDLNRMAVELAKVSLWLHTFTVGAPLSFLDHHLRWGNSLVGAMAQDAAKEMSVTKTTKKISKMAKGRAKMRGEKAREVAVGYQVDIFGGPFKGLLLAAEIMRGISRLSDATLEEVEQSEALFREFDTEARPYKQLLDVFVSEHFGEKQARDFLQLYGVDSLKANKKKLAKEWLQVYENAQDLFLHNRFFHWDLEFPEVFIDLGSGSWKSNPGFDAVVGNPPYVRQEELKPLKPYFKESYASFNSSADLYLYFYEQGIELLHRNGRISYITSGTFAKTKSAKTFRKWLPMNVQLEKVVDFGENQPFEGAEMVRPSIMVLRRGNHENDFIVLFMEGTTILQPLDLSMEEYGFVCVAGTLAQNEWTFQSAEKSRLADKIFANSETLESLLENQIFNGIKTALNDAFYIDQDTYDEFVSINSKSREILKPMLRGADCRPWYQKDKGRWCILIPMGWTKSKFGDGLTEKEAWNNFKNLYPAIANHLKPFTDKAKKRQDQGDFWWELRACSYYDAFQNSKIFWNDITKLPRFSWSEDELYINLQYRTELRKWMTVIKSGKFF